LLRSADQDGKLSADDIENIFNSFTFENAIKDIKSKHLLDRHLVASGYLILPQSVLLDRVWSWVKKPRPHLVRKPIQFFEVPFIPVLQQLLNEDDILHCVNHPRPPQDPDHGLLRDYQDGEFVRSHPIFGQDPKALKILLYYDDVEISNPLGSKTKTHKLAMFYWSLGNIYPEFRSTLRVINLLCIVKSVHLKKYGLNRVLKNFVTEIKNLESPGGKKLLIKGIEQQFRGSLLMFIGDTLASNFVGGFKEGVAFAHKPCRSCLGTKDSIKASFDERDFVLRDRFSHAQHCAAVDDEELTKDEKLFWSREYGVMGRSVLTDIETFDVTKCMVQDLMHVGIEGLLELEIRHFLIYLTKSRCITLKKLNDKLSMFDYGHLKKDKPSLIEPRHLDHKLRQNCVQLITLGTVLPFVINESVEDDDERLLNFILLLQIINGFLSFEMKKSDVNVLKLMVEVHHVAFVRLYRSATPKCHYMIHFPSQILNFGPLRHQWCMRFEAAHCRFKHMASVVKNFQNIPRTLSYRHQSLQCAELFKLAGDPAKNILYKGDIISPGQSATLGIYEHSLHVSNCLNIFDDRKLVTTRHVTVQGTAYKLGGVILTCNNENELPSFGRIIDIAVVDGAKILVFKELRTLYYDEAKNAYAVSLLPTSSALMIKNLIHPHPLSLFTIKSSSFVVLLNHPRNEFY
jgi:hypothetical protein